MIQMLKANPGFSPCPIQDGDELYANGIFVFNITKMLAHLQNNPDGVDLVEIAVSDFNAQSCIDESHMTTVDISLPVVMAEISPGHYNLIDGNHRMEKARRSGVSKIWAYKFTMHQHISFLTSTKAYLSYVEYWNGKAKLIRRQEEPNKQIHRTVRRKQK